MSLAAIQHTMLLETPEERDMIVPTTVVRPPAPLRPLNAGERPTLADARVALYRSWGYTNFRPGQGEIIASVLEGRDVVGILPTGAGKSITFQLPALLMPGLTIVVSPLISLMKDQIDALARRGIPAAFVNSSITPKQSEAVLRHAEAGHIKLLYVAPERFDSIAFRERIARVKVSLFAIDEAHCLSEWGHDFRPAYMRLGEQRPLLGDPQILALTATATPQVRNDIIQHLKLDDPAVHVMSFDRPNLAWRVVPTVNDDAKSAMLRQELRGLKGSAIVYCATRKAVDQVATYLNDHGYKAYAYHAEKPDRERKLVQDRFMSEPQSVIVATNAFGMGVDKSSVRRVIHWSFPATVEAYYQEAGRAGRDGDPADCVILFSGQDQFTHEFLIGISHPTKDWYGRVYEALLKHLDATDTVIVNQAELARRMAWPRGNPLSRCLQVLHEAGIIHHTTRTSAGIFVKLLATNDQIRKTLAPESRIDDRIILRELWRLANGDALRLGTLLRARDLRSVQGELLAVRKTLKRLEAEGILTYQEETTGTRVLNKGLNPKNLPLPWDQLESRRNMEFAKLRHMIAYAETGGCRRRYLLRYFGDPRAAETCGNCDTCRAAS